MNFIMKLKKKYKDKARLLFRDSLCYFIGTENLEEDRLKKLINMMPLIILKTINSIEKKTRK